MRKISIIFIAVLLFISCKKQDQLGPDIAGIYGPVTVTQAFSVNTTNVDFSGGEKVFFNASFQNDAVWVITIKGNTSKAVKTISGISKTINVENSTWLGEADNAPSFQTENITAILTFKNTTDTFNVDPITITGTIVSESTDDVLVTDFVVSKVQNYGAVPVPPSKWPSDFPLTVNTETAYGYPDGNAYMIMGPTAPWQGGGSPYVDILTISPGNAMQDYGTYFPLYADPAKVYFNIMVYNTGTPTWLQISFFENDVIARHIDIKPNWTGWKLVSVRYSDLVANSSDAAANVLPQKITGIQFVLLSNLAVTDPALTTTPIKTAFDHIIFTHNKPYQP